MDKLTRSIALAGIGLYVIVAVSVVYVAGEFLAQVMNR